MAGHNLLCENVTQEKSSRKITIVTKGRTYVMQGQVKKFASSGIRSRAREYTFYLFSDALIYANKIVIENETHYDMSDLVCSVVFENINRDVAVYGSVFENINREHKLT